MLPHQPPSKLCNGTPQVSLSGCTSNLGDCKQCPTVRTFLSAPAKISHKALLKSAFSPVHVPYWKPSITLPGAAIMYDTQPMPSPLSGGVLSRRPR